MAKNRGLNGSENRSLSRGNLRENRGVWTKRNIQREAEKKEMMPKIQDWNKVMGGKEPPAQMTMFLIESKVKVKILTESKVKILTESKAKILRGHSSLEKGGKRLRWTLVKF